jgi:hypothetical protein
MKYMMSLDTDGKHAQAGEEDAPEQHCEIWR